jgi:3-phenylpropionate/trans-cinnamate dioxygenase ferredoxin subunit
MPAARLPFRPTYRYAPPAKLAVRTHEVVIVDGVINVVLDDGPPNLPPGVSTRAAEIAAGEADQ